VVIGEPATDETGFLESIRPRMLIRERTRAGTASPREDGAAWTTISQRDAGAVTLLAYPDRLEASGFLGPKTITLERPR
jgi:hypothetical protein